MLLLLGFEFTGCLLGSLGKAATSGRGAELREQDLWHVQRAWGLLSVHFGNGHQCYWAEEGDKRPGWFCFVTKMGRMSVEENGGWLNECTLATPVAPRGCLIFWDLWHGILMQVTFLLQGRGHFEYHFKSWVAPFCIKKMNGCYENTKARIFPLVNKFPIGKLLHIQQFSAGVSTDTWL